MLKRYILCFLLTAAVSVSQSFCYDGDQLELRWSYSAGGQLAGAPAAGSSGEIYIYSEDRHVHALSPGGELLWRHRMPGSPAAAPVVGPDGSIYIVGSGGVLTALNRGGGLLWEWDAEEAPAGAPAVAADGTLFYALESGGLAALSHSGRLRWRADAGFEPAGGPVIESGKAVFLTSSDGRLACYSHWGEKLWVVDTAAGRDPFAAVFDDIIAVCGAASVAAYDFGGRELWTLALPSAEALVSLGSAFAVLDSTGRIAAYDLGAGLLWENDERRYGGSMSASADGIYAGSGAGSIALLSKDGILLKETSVDGRLTEHRLAGGQLLSGSEQWIVRAFGAGESGSGGWSQKGADSANSGCSGRRLSRPDLGHAGVMPSYLYHRRMLGSPLLDDRMASLAEIEDMLDRQPESCGPDWLLPLLYDAAAAAPGPGNGSGAADDSGTYPQARAKAVQLLGRIGSIESSTVIADMLGRERDTLVASAMMEALGSLGSNCGNMVLGAIYGRMSRLSGLQRDDRAAIAAVRAIDLLHRYSGAGRDLYAGRVLLDIYRGNYSRVVRDEARIVLGSLE